MYANNFIKNLQICRYFLKIYVQYLRMKPVLNTEVFMTLGTQHFMKVSLPATFLWAPEYLVIIFEVNFFRFWRQLAFARQTMFVKMLPAEYLATFALKRQEIYLVAVFILAVFTEGRKLHFYTEPDRLYTKLLMFSVSKALRGVSIEKCYAINKLKFTLSQWKWKQ